MKEFDDDLGAWSDKDLALSGLFSVANALQRIVEDGGLDHACGFAIGLGLIGR